jgi:hypothetical protein
MNNLSSIILLLLLLLLCSPVLTALSAELSGGNLKAPTFQYLSQKYSSVIIRANLIGNSQSVIEPNVISNIKRAKQGGLSAEIYIDICRSVKANDLVDKIYSTIAASKTTYATLWVKVQTNQASGCGWDGHSQQ